MRSPDMAAWASKGGSAVWHGPDLHVERSRVWNGTVAAVYRRGAGESRWRNAQHRLVLAETALGRVGTRVNGARALDIVAVPGTLGFHPGDVTFDITHGSGRVIQILQDTALYRSLALDMFGRSDVGLEPIVSLDDPLVGRIMRTIADEIEGGPGDRLLVDGLSRALAVQVLRRFAPIREPSGPPRGIAGERLRRVLDYIEAHLGEEMSLAELADVACFSPYYFSRCFKQALGVGLHQYVAQRRVERAKDLMRGTAHPLAAIAHAVGFTDQSHFTSTFRRETGITPGRFRLALA